MACDGSDFLSTVAVDGRLSSIGTLSSLCRVWSRAGPLLHPGRVRGGAAIAVRGVPHQGFSVEVLWRRRNPVSTVYRAVDSSRLGDRTERNPRDGFVLFTTGQRRMSFL